MVRYLKLILRILSPRDRKKLVFLFFGVFLNGIWEVVGIGSIMPFIAVASDTDIIKSNKYLSWAYERFGFSDTVDFLFAFGIVVVAVLVVSNFSRALVDYAIKRFSAVSQHFISLALLRRYLHQPYLFFLNQNSADLSKNILSEVWTLVNNVVVPGLEMCSRIIIAFLIVGLLVAVDPVLALLMALVMSTIYAIIYIAARRKLDHIGKERLKLNGVRYKITSEAMGGIKDVKLLGKEKEFLAAFEKPSWKFSLYTTASDIIADIPKYALETVAFSGILFIILYLIWFEGDFQQIVPLVGLYAFAAYRLMPSLQFVFRGSVKIKANLSVIEMIHRHLREEGSEETETVFTQDKLSFASTLELRNVTFSYPNTTDAAVKALSLAVPCNTSVAFVGPTGCGKTTAVDIILGLLTPQGGEILVDGKLITRENIRSWQNNLGYVPQTIFLTDDTVARNIAFGVPADQVDPAAVEQAAKAANIYDFIVKELPKGFETEVGERGVRLSGGQRQRIGIARALYNNPSVLILDEATSALDGITENAIMDAIHSLSGKKTIVMIAHRLSTVKECRTIFYLEGGRITDSGSYDELVGRNEYFRKMAGGKGEE